VDGPTSSFLSPFLKRPNMFMKNHANVQGSGLTLVTSRRAQSDSNVNN
jgi:hypothetical protein